MNNTIKKPNIDEINATLAGVATKDVARQVAEWFATPEGVAFVEESMEQYKGNILDDIEDLYVDHNIPSSKMLSAINTEIKQKSRRRILYRIAAVFIPIIFISALFIHLFSSSNLVDVEYKDIYVAKGEQLDLELSDGSLVSINSDTHFRYPVEFVGKQREVYLNGEAYFEVESDVKNRFVVHIENSQVVVTGTRFNVDAYQADNTVLVSLYEGAVNFDTPDKRHFSLTPGETLSYKKSSQECSISKSSLGDPDWISRNIAFKDTPIIDITKTLERWFDVKFIFKDPQVSQNVYSLTLSNPTLESVLYDLGKISPMYFEYDISKKVVYITARY
ncbi:MAG: FecR domain-containing protein [Rikenellaceae bacterium]